MNEDIRVSLDLLLSVETTLMEERDLLDEATAVLRKKGEFDLAKKLSAGRDERRAVLHRLRRVISKARKIEADRKASRARAGEFMVKTMRFCSAALILGLLPPVTLEQVKAAYRELAKVHHPDVGGDAARFKMVSEAYQDLLELLPDAT